MFHTVVNLTLHFTFINKSPAEAPAALESGSQCHTEGTPGYYTSDDEDASG